MPGGAGVVVGTAVVGDVVGTVVVLVVVGAVVGIVVTGVVGEVPFSRVTLGGVARPPAGTFTVNVSVR